MSNHSNFPGSGQRLDGSRTMTQMSPTSSDALVQSNTDSGGKDNRKFSTLDGLKTNSLDTREAPVPVVPSPVESNGNYNADQAADQSNSDQGGGDNVEVVKQYGNISLGDNHQVGRNIFDFGGAAEEQSSAADEIEAAENSDSTDQVRNDASNNNKTNRLNVKIGTLFGSTYIGNNHRKAGDLYRFSRN